MLKSFDSYVIALLKLLDDLPHRQGRSRTILEQFEERYRDEIPSAHYRKNPTGRVQWIVRVQWARQKAVQLELMDSPARGIWRLTEAGHRWLVEHPDATRLEDTEAPKQYKFTQKQESLPPDRGTPDGLDAILAREIGNIRAFLQGRSDYRPSDEKLCDWVNFCYTFELYAEAHELFTLVSPNGVNPWYFERTRKLARICGAKASVHR